MKRVWTLVFLCAGALLSARELSDIMLYFAPATGGSPEEREFFDVNLPNEIRDDHYKVVKSEEEADFTVSSTISGSGADSFSRFTLGLITSADRSPLLELSWDYANVEELYVWDIGSILAPAPAVAAAPLPFPAPVAEKEPRGARLFYTGFRGGVSLGEYAFQLTPDYNPGYSVGVSGEGGLVMELRLFRFLAFQAEADFVYEVFDVPRAFVEGDIRPVDTFASMSLIFPLAAKVPMELGKFVLSLYAGGYYIMALGEAGKTSDGATEQLRVRTIDPAFGVMAGTDLGAPLGPGEFFVDLRYGKKLGATIIGEGEGPLYIQDRVSMSFGYKFGLGKR